MAAANLKALGILVDDRKFVSNASTSSGKRTASGVEIFERSGKSSMAEKLENDDKYIRHRSVADFERVLADFDQQLKSSGGATNNLSDALGLSVTMCYKVFTDGAVLTAKQLADTRAWLKEDINADPAWQRKSNLEKQQSYERYGINAMMLFLDYKALLADRQQLSQVQEVLRPMQALQLKRNYENLKNQSYRWLKDIFDPRAFNNFKLTEEGFREK